MEIKVRNEQVELKYTFNSFKFMREFDMSVIGNVENKPFEIIPVLETLLLGALNSNSKKKYTATDVENFLEEFIEEGSIVELLNGLMDLLQESSFFKSLQREESKTE